MLQTADIIVKSKSSLIEKFGEDKFEEGLVKINESIEKVANSLNKSKLDTATAMLRLEKEKGNNGRVLFLIAWFGS